MILPDVNVLIYAFRADSPHHARCRTWLNDVVLGETRFGLSRLVLSAVVRITTSPRIFQTPSTLEDAFGFCDDLTSQPHAEMIEPGPRHWDIFRRLCVETGTTGPRTTDAWLAAIAIESGCEWITMDRDFGRFPGLRWGGPTSLDTVT